MASPEPSTGWAWFDPPAPTGPIADDLCRRAAACFAGSTGQSLLHHLRQSFLDRRLPPTATDAELRHLEGQRSVVGHLLQLIERGRAEAATLPPPLSCSKDPS